MEKQGILIGRWIGKYGRAALIGMQVKESLHLIKDIPSPKQNGIKIGLKKVKPEFLNAAPFSLLPSIPQGAIPVYPADCWVMPYPAGALIGTSNYQKYGLTRIAPRSCDQVLALLSDQVSQATEEMGRSFYDKFLLRKKRLFNPSFRCEPIYPLLVELQMDDLNM